MAAAFRPTSQLRSSLKLLALPLARPTDAGKAPLFYLHAIKPTSVPTGELSYISRATNKAADMWSKLGQADEGTWKRKAFTQGERFMDRIEYEEWALKAIDPALAPTPWASLSESSSSSASADTPATPQSSADAKSGAQSEPAPNKPSDKVALLYPKSLLSSTPLLASLKEQLAHREPHHRSAMIKCLWVAPLTFPFAIIPIVPNFPLFYVLWRAWSHWRAWKASSYLNKIVAGSQLHLVESTELESIYDSSTSSSQQLLTPDKVPKIVKAFNLSGDEKAELNRAVAQVENRIKAKGEEDKTKERVEAESKDKA